MNDNSYMQWFSMSDKALGETIGKFIQHHRLKQNMSQADASSAAGISRSTLSLLERGEKVTLSTLLQVLRVLELLHVMDVFVVNDEISPIEYAKLSKKGRKKASPSKGKNENESNDLGW